MRHTTQSQDRFMVTLSLATLTLLLAACASTSDDTGVMTGSSSSAMTDDAASSVGDLPPSPPSADNGMPSSPDAMAPGKTYADGTFSATGTYTSPGGQETVEVSLTLQDGIVTDATYKGDAERGRSKQYQEQFGAGYRQMVVGKSIDSLSLDVVNGSSLTPKGFMDAVQKIAAQAKA